MSKCQQCDKSAIMQFGNGVMLCVDCGNKFQQIIDRQNANLEAQLNYLTEHMEMSVGLPGILPRYPQRKPPVNTGPITVNNIKIDQSVIGSINTGTVHSIEVAMNQISNAGNQELGSALKTFSEAIANSKDLIDKQKNELLEQVAFLAEQGAQKKEKRPLSVIRGVLSTIRDGVATVHALQALWSTVSPHFHAFFGC